MQTAINYVTEHLDYFCIPLCGLCVLRIVMCTLELRRSEHVRRTKGRYHSRCSHYTEIYLFAGVFIGGLLTLLLGRLWLLGLPVMAALGYIGYRMGRKKGLAIDEVLRAEAKLHSRSDSTSPSPTLLVEELLRDEENEDTSERN